MNVNLTALTAHLKKGLAPLYHLFGAEILLLEEAADDIRRAARGLGFGERIRYHLEAGFDWNQLLASGQSRSLFADKKIIELRMPTGKPGDAGAKALARYVDGIDGGDTVLLLLSGAIDKRARGARWFQQVEAAGVAVECPSVQAAQLPAWIERRMAAKGLQFAADAPPRLAQLVEGNLLAAAQEIDLLALLSPRQKINAAAVASAVADHARFNVYALVDACLAGASERCTRILHSLRRNQAEPIVILWALTREFRTLCNVSAAIGAGRSRQQSLQQYGVWSSRSNLLGAALQRLTSAHWEHLLRRLALSDLMLKGQVPMQRENIWEEIESIILKACGLRIR